MYIPTTYIQELIDHKLTAMQYRILMLLWIGTPKTAAQITRELKINHIQTTLPRLKQLEKLGYIVEDRIEGRNRFLKANKQALEKEEIEMIIKDDKYLEAVFDTLKIISQNEQKRFEYTPKTTALYDYNTQMEESYDRGKAEMLTAAQQAARDMNMTAEQIQELIRRMSKQS